IAVVILVLVSFTGVVGYQTTKSSTIAKASPLFSVRTSRAIDEESKDLTCDYVGKGEETTLSFPTSDSRNAQMQRVIDIISRMDDKRFNRFVKLFVYQANNNNKMKDINNNAIRDALHHIRDNPELLKNHFNVGKTDDLLFTKDQCDTAVVCDTSIFYCPLTIGGDWNILCSLGVLMGLIIFGSLFILGGILYSLCESLPFLKTFN
ncbi:MAG: hypothetical protein KAQ84_04550, partial [Thermoplasmatales archaeon]|nr:hypothetical protein [Thermoplasmatales archaeon]